MRRLAQLLLLSSVCLAFANGCGDDATHSTTSPAPLATNLLPSPSAAGASAYDDTALAESMLMTKDDFPRDYLEKRRVIDPAANAFNSCRSDTEQGRTGSASTDDWLFDGQSPAISEIVTVFATMSDASVRMESAPALIDCVVKAINDGKLNEPAIELSGGTSTAISIDAGGERSVAFQVQSVRMFPGQSARGTAQYTLVFVSRGRVVAEIVVRGTGEPFDPAELSDFAQSAVARIQQQQ